MKFGNCIPGTSVLLEPGHLADNRGLLAVGHGDVQLVRLSHALSKDLRVEKTSVSYPSLRPSVLRSDNKNRNPEPACS